MYQSVLIPLDGSPVAERVLAHIERMISPRETSIILLYVLELQKYYTATSPAVLASFDSERWRQDAQGYLDRVAGELREMGFRVRPHVIEGDVATSICDVAEAQEIDLIAMTTHGRTGATRWVLGSVADRVVRSAKQPVLLVRTETAVSAKGGIQRILVPLDGSDLAELALPQAQQLAQEKNAEILTLRVIEPVEDIALYTAGGTEILAEASTLDLEGSAEEYLKSVQQRLYTAGVTSRFTLIRGRPAETILDVAQAEEVDLIVMSTHGRSGLSRWVYGSVADKVLHGTQHPLLLIRARGRTTSSRADNAEEAGDLDEQDSGTIKAVPTK